jgi:serine/threonine protein kinase
VDAHLARPPYFLVMELLPGESLRARLQREYALDVATAVWVARQTAEAIAALHRAGYVHGDVKPDNVRLVDAGTAVLIDLGFAHKPGENAALLDEGFVLGTANYLAPELCESEAVDDPAADVFALGVTLFETMTGELPYPPGSVVETMERHRSEEPSPLCDHAGDWPPRLVRLMHRLLARKPHLRPRPLRVVQELVALEIATLQRRSA